MSWCFAFLLLILRFTTAYSDGVQWKLAFNINAADGHNFGYGAKAWEDDSDVGSDATAFNADYKNYDVTVETANYLAIVRHQNGVCEAARVWKFLTPGKTLKNYLNTKQSLRLKATHDKYSYSYVSDTMEGKDKDPIFAVDGGLVFNWWYANNGVRIGNSGAYVKGGLPGINVNDDGFRGIGNEYGGKTKEGLGSSSWWFDVGLYIKKFVRKMNKHSAQGKDHGTSMFDGKLYGQYAVYTSDDEDKFLCKGVRLQNSQYDPVLVKSFERVDRGNNGLLDYEEFIFDIVDVNKDGVISQEDYSKARLEGRLVETASDGGVAKDFDRIDKDGDQKLHFDEIVFDIADTNKDGHISLQEYHGVHVYIEGRE